MTDCVKVSKSKSSNNFYQSLNPIILVVTPAAMASSAPQNNGQQQPAALQRQDSPMVDEMFDGSQMDIGDNEDSAAASTGMGGAGPASSLMSELTSSDRTVHADFYNNFGDLFDDKNLD